MLQAEEQRNVFRTPRAGVVDAVRGPVFEGAPNGIQSEGRRADGAWGVLARAGCGPLAGEETGFGNGALASVGRIMS